MRRLLTFSLDESRYIIQENGSAIFSINVNDLKFDSLEFYSNIYKGNKTTIMQFTYDIQEDPFKKGTYIFQWLSDIISAIRDEFSEEETEEVSSEEPILYRTIHLYDLAACAGNGLFVDDAAWSEYKVTNKEADYAVKISGHSMESVIPDGSIALVKQISELQNNDIGIFNVNGESMCKHYIVNGKKQKLASENKSEEYKTIEITPNDTFAIQGKVIEVISPQDKG